MNLVQQLIVRHLFIDPVMPIWGWLLFPAGALTLAALQLIGIARFLLHKG